MNHSGNTLRCKQDMSETTIDQNWTTKTDSLPLTYFIKHLVCETKKSSQKHNEH
jgi:hypothetical protein